MDPVEAADLRAAAPWRRTLIQASAAGVRIAGVGGQAPCLGAFVARPAAAPAGSHAGRWVTPGVWEWLVEEGLTNGER